MSDYYYQAGTSDGWWSRHTRRSYDGAVAEAQRAARRHGGRPVVGRWERRFGLGGHGESEVRFVDAADRWQS